MTEKPTLSQIQEAYATEKFPGLVQDWHAHITLFLELGIAYADIPTTSIDEFMQSSGYIWDTEKNEYVPKPVETDIRPIRYISK